MTKSITLLRVFVILGLGRGSLACTGGGTLRGQHHHVDDHRDLEERSVHFNKAVHAPHPDAFLYEDMARRSRELTETSSYLCANRSPPDDLKVKMGVVFGDWKKNNELNRRNLAQVNHTINVAFHVIYNSTRGSVTQDDIHNGYMASLQKAFANSPFYFKFQQVTYTQNDAWYNCGWGNEDVIKQALYIPGKDVLNVYLCDPVSAFDGFSSYGWSSLPIHAGTKNDGIMLMNPSVVDPLSSYQTLVHETGHFMGLFHSFEGGCQPGVWAEEGYTIGGDGVADTPSHVGPTEQFYGAESCWTDYVLDTCQDVPGIDPGVDPVDNYMNYLTTKCWSERGHFTAGQIERMLGEFEHYRVPLLQSNSGNNSSTTNGAENTNTSLWANETYLGTQVVLDTP